MAKCGRVLVCKDGLLKSKNLLLHTFDKDVYILVLSAQMFKPNLWPREDASKIIYNLLYLCQFLPSSMAPAPQKKPTLCAWPWTLLDFRCSFIRWGAYSTHGRSAPMRGEKLALPPIGQLQKEKTTACTNEFATGCSRRLICGESRNKFGHTKLCFDITSEHTLWFICDGAIYKS